MVNETITQVFEEKVQAPYTEFKKKHHVIAGFLSLFAMLMIAIVALVSGKTKSAQAGASDKVEITAPIFDSASGAATMATADEAAHDDLENTAQQVSFEVPITPNDGLALAAGSHIPASPRGVSKRSEVRLTDDMAELATKIDQFFAKRNKYVIMTSGVRSGESQLSLIKQRIVEKGGVKLHPNIKSASMQDTTVWVKAWNWLRAKRVPINPPGDIRQAGRIVRKSSDHLKGKAMDFISPNLKDLHKMLTQFAASKEAKQLDIKIRAVVLEPYCVHIALG